MRRFAGGGCTKHLLDDREREQPGQDTSGQWWQACFDDPQSVALKTQLADGLSLAGVGVWALGIEPSAVGQEVSVQVQVPAGGTYQVQVAPSLGPRYGVCTVEVDGRAVGGFNGYAPALAGPQAALPIGTVTLEPGTHTLTFMVGGKDPRSAGYLAGIDVVVLNPLS